MLTNGPKSIEINVDTWQQDAKVTLILIVSNHYRKLTVT